MAMSDSPFHADELDAQARAGRGASGAGIRNFMPDQHRSFFELLPYLFVATADADGWPVASVLHGETGFVRSPDATTLRIEACMATDDPAAAGWQADRDVGLLGLGLSHRRRNRANGTLAAVAERGATVAITQSFGNCAQYIQTRQPAAHRRVVPPVEYLAGLDAPARQLIG